MSIIPQDTSQKQCTKCLQRLPATTEFFDRRGNGLKPRCKACRKVDRKIYNDAHTEVNKRYAQEHKEEIRTRGERYRQEHQEEIHAKKKQYYDAHQEECVAKGRKYHAAHREKANERRRQRRNAHLEEERMHCRQYHAAHLEKVQRISRRHYEKHHKTIKERQRQDRRNRPEVHRMRTRISQQKRRVRRKNITGTVTPQQIQAKLKAQKYCCYYAACGYAKFEQRKDGMYIFHLDHTIPVSRPDFHPLHDIDHIVLACPSCNQSKHNKLPHEWPEGGRLL